MASSECSFPVVCCLYDTYLGSWFRIKQRAKANCWICRATVRQYGYETSCPALNNGCKGSRTCIWQQTIGEDANRRNFASDAGPQLKLLWASFYNLWVMMMWLDLICTSLYIYIVASHELFRITIILNYIVRISFNQECNVWQGMPQHVHAYTSVLVNMSQVCFAMSPLVWWRHNFVEHTAQ